MFDLILKFKIGSFTNPASTLGTANVVDKAPKRPRDLNQWAKHMVDLATGVAQETELPKESPAAELGRRGGKIGGKVRAERMTAKQRSSAARKVAKARWGK